MNLLQVTWGWSEILWTSLISIVLVFSMLILLVFIMQIFGKVVTYHRATAPKQTLSLHEEEVAAIMTALKLYKTDLHDKESEILTILSIKRAYSPWSSKIHGLTQMPNRK